MGCAPEGGLVRIIGLGNPLRGDDGIGVAVAECLARETLPAGVEVVDAGTGGITLLGLLEGLKAAVIVDAADLGRPPGSVVRAEWNELRLPAPELGASLHQAGLAAALSLGRELGALPELVLFLVQVGQVTPGAGLSEPLAAGLATLARRVREEARRLAG